MAAMFERPVKVAPRLEKTRVEMSASSYAPNGVDYRYTKSIIRSQERCICYVG